METRDDRKTKPGQNFSSYDVKAGCPEDTVAIMETKREHVETAGSVKHFISNGKDIRHSAQNRSSYEKFNVADYHEVVLFYCYMRLQLFLEKNLDKNCVTSFETFKLFSGHII